MPEGTCPVQWTGRQAVVTLPQDIDSSLLMKHGR